MDVGTEMLDFYSSTSSDDQSSINSVIHVEGVLSDSGSTSADSSAPPTPVRNGRRGESDRGSGDSGEDARDSDGHGPDSQCYCEGDCLHSPDYENFDDVDVDRENPSSEDNSEPCVRRNLDFGDSSGDEPAQDGGEEQYLAPQGSEVTQYVQENGGRRGLGLDADDSTSEEEDEALRREQEEAGDTSDSSSTSEDTQM